MFECQLAQNVSGLHWQKHANVLWQWYEAKSKLMAELLLNPHQN